MPVPAKPNSPGNGSLGLADAVSIIVGIVIGAGIYETAPFILSCVATPAEAMADHLRRQPRRSCFGDQSGPHSPLCGSGSGDAPAAQWTARTAR